MAAIRSRGVAVLAVPALLACLTACTGAHQKAAMVPKDGPLVGDSVASGGAIRVKPGALVFLLGATQLNNKGTQPVRIVRVKAWDADQMTLAGADLLTGSAAPTGFLGPEPSPHATLADAERTSHLPAGASQRLVGSVLEPCCHPVYHLALAYRPVLPARPTVTAAGSTYVQAGYMHGIEITYELPDHHRYRTLVRASISYCTGQDTDAACQRVADAQRSVEQAELEAVPGIASLTAKGTWHEH